MYLDCQRLHFWRHILGMVPQRDETTALLFGHLIHECLAMWHTRGELPNELACTKIRELIDGNYPNRSGDLFQKQLHHYATAMMAVYCSRYSDDPWEEVLAVEKFFCGPIVNPKTGHNSRKIAYAGMADGLVRRADGSIWLLEHKTVGATAFNGSYLERLWEDPQIISYCYYLEQQEEVDITGIIYNVLVKPALTQKIGENGRAIRSPLCRTLRQEQKRQEHRKTPVS